MFIYYKNILFILSVVMISLVSKSSLAADAAHESLIGFSPDGRYFAFEEYGIQDGSGFPYSKIYIIDLIEGERVPGSPFSKLLRSESALLSAARRAARLDANPALFDVEIDVPATVLFARGVGELRTLETPITVNVPFPSSLVNDQPPHSFMLSISTHEISGPSDCPDGRSRLGFELIQTLNGTQNVLHRDETIPASRFCPLDYRISRVIAPAIPGKADLGVVLISVFQFGFEGLDRRFMVVPVPLP